MLVNHSKQQEDSEVLKMNNLWRQLLGLLWIVEIISEVQANKRLVCYYDSAQQITLAELENALPLCTHLVYGYAGLSEKNKEIFSINVARDGKYYSEITAMKIKYPHLKIYLSVRGDKDPAAAHDNEYLHFLESGSSSYKLFIQSSMALLKFYGFDGLDLAFQFPRNKPRRVHSTIGRVAKEFKKFFTENFVVDPNAKTHKQQFAQFVQEIHHDYTQQNLSLTLTVLPNVNSSWYFDILKIQENFDYINLLAFDFVTPERNPHEADYSAAIYFKDGQNRPPQNNIDFQVQHWIDNGCPADKLNLGIATYGHAWDFDLQTDTSKLPLVQAEGPASKSIHLQKPRPLSYTEICLMFTKDDTPQTAGPHCLAIKVTDIEKKYGNYALCTGSTKGVVLSFDDPHFAGIKAEYAVQKGLGGVSLNDINHDDFGGICRRLKYPILRSIRRHLFKEP